MRASGFVTAGGKSTRMGVDKAWLEVGGTPMILRVIRALQPVTGDVSVIANDPEYRRLGLPVFADSNPGIGPLEAIRTALANSSRRLAVLAACDIPFVTTELFQLLVESAGNHQAVVPTDAAGLLEPLCAVYSTSALESVELLIAQGRRKVSDLFDVVPTRIVTFDEIRHLTGCSLFFRNVNTPDEYTACR
jgi:molybdenum cofactor guanylyltransferase